MSQPIICTVADDCTGPAVLQWQRDATQAEYDAIPDHFRPRDGIALVPVFGCADHQLDGERAALTHRSDCAGVHTDDAPCCDAEPTPVARFPVTTPPVLAGGLLGH